MHVSRIESSQNEFTERRLGCTATENQALYKQLGLIIAG